jgi:hypothetical protein
MKPARMAGMAAAAALLPWALLMLAGDWEPKVTLLFDAPSTNGNFAHMDFNPLGSKLGPSVPRSKPGATAVNIGPSLHLLLPVPVPEAIGPHPRGQMRLNPLPPVPMLKPGIYQTYPYSIILIRD